MSISLFYFFGEGEGGCRGGEKDGEKRRRGEREKEGNGERREKGNEREGQGGNELNMED